MIRVDDFLFRERSATYQCFDFARDVWLESFGEDLGERLQGLLGESAGRRLTVSGVKSCRSLQTPSNACFVLFQRAGHTPHIGVYYLGRVLHLAELMPQYQPLAVVARRFQRVRFFL